MNPWLIIKQKGHALYKMYIQVFRMILLKMPYLKAPVNLRYLVPLTSNIVPSYLNNAFLKPVGEPEINKICHLLVCKHIGADVPVMVKFIP